MSFARIICRAQVGLAAPRVDVEVHLGAGLPCFNIVGLPATEVKESKERVRAALVNSGFDFPAGRITVNLAPADLPKDGGRFDLAIAVGIVVASPVILAIAAAVWLDDGFPIFFGHRRQARGGRIFRCWKFRTMRRDAESLVAQLRKLNM